MEKIESIIKNIQQLEKELKHEFHKKQQQFFYTLDARKVRFREEVRQNHKKLLKKIRTYLRDASLLNIATVPVIWSCMIPALILDAFATVFQAVCFPVYKIPKVQRDKYVVFDRHALDYLNLIEKINCYYCAYFNGLMAYVQEIAARTEQYWCPIKHAHRLGSIHSRYRFFFDYGDADSYRKRIEEVRRNFSDLEE